MKINFILHAGMDVFKYYFLIFKVVYLNINSCEIMVAKITEVTQFVILLFAICRSDEKKKKSFIYFYQAYMILI